MGEQTIWSQIKDIIGAISFNVYLWANACSAEEYWAMIQREMPSFETCQVWLFQDGAGI